MARQLKPDDEVTYITAHHRVHRTRGSAKAQVCIGCGHPAVHWSYNGGSARERVEDIPKTGLMKYSPDPADYSPRCLNCHREHDGHRSSTMANLVRRLNDGVD